MEFCYQYESACEYEESYEGEGDEGEGESFSNNEDADESSYVCEEPTVD